MFYEIFESLVGVGGCDGVMVQWLSSGWFWSGSAVICMVVMKSSSVTSRIMVFFIFFCRLPFYLYGFFMY